MSKKKEKKDVPHDDELLSGLTIILHWFKGKIIRWALTGIRIIFFAGVIAWLIIIAAKFTDQFWSPILGIAPEGDRAFYGFGLLATALLAILIGLAKDLIENITSFVERILPQPMKTWRNWVLGKIPRPELLKALLTFVLGNGKQKDEKKNSLKNGQPLIFHPYGLWGSKELGIITGRVKFQGTWHWKVAVLSPPMPISGGRVAFIEDWQIVTLIKLSWAEIGQYIATYGAVSPDEFEEIDKADFGIKTEIDPNSLSKIEEIFNIEIEALRKRLGN